MVREIAFQIRMSLLSLLPLLPTRFSGLKPIVSLSEKTCQVHPGHICEQTSGMGGGKPRMYFEETSPSYIGFIKLSSMLYSRWLQPGSATQGSTTSPCSPLFWEKELCFLLNVQQHVCHHPERLMTVCAANPHSPTHNSPDTLLLQFFPNETLSSLYLLLFSAR